MKSARSACARAAGAKIIRTAHAVAPHHVRNDIDTSLECGRSSVDFVDRVFIMGLRGGPHPRCRPAVRLDGRMMPPIGPAHATGGARPARARRTRTLYPVVRGRSLLQSLPAGPGSSMLMRAFGAPVFVIAQTQRGTNTGKIGGFCSADVLGRVPIN